MASNKRKISSDTVVSLSAIIIAIASIVVTIWQGIENRNHNRLSVRPKLEINFQLTKDNFGYILKNNGLGPAVITDKKLFVDGKEISYSGFSGYDDFIEKLGLKDRKVTHMGIYPGKTIKANEQINIIGFSINKSDDLDSLLPKIFSRVKIKIGYKSMYDERFACEIPK